MAQRKKSVRKTKKAIVTGGLTDNGNLRKRKRRAKRK